MAQIGGNSSSGLILTAVDFIGAALHTSQTQPANDTFGFLGVGYASIAAAETVFNSALVAGVETNIYNQSGLSLFEANYFVNPTIAGSFVLKIYSENVLKKSFTAINGSSVNYTRIVLPALPIKDLKITVTATAVSGPCQFYTIRSKI